MQDTLSSSSSDGLVSSCLCFTAHEDAVNGCRSVCVCIVAYVFLANALL